MLNLISCRVDELGFPKWNGVDYLRWSYLPTNWNLSTGTAHLWLYKTSWLIHNRGLLKQYAREAEVPLLLLAGVAAAEVGGTPERFKSVVVLQLKHLLESVLRREDNRLSNSTSVGSVAIQLGVAARTMGIRPDILTPLEQFQLSQCLLNDRFNIRVVAFHLRDLIRHDFPDANPLTLTDEQIIVVGSRYNRGIERNRQDFIDSLSMPVGHPQREYSEYGRRIIEKKDAIMRIMRGI